MLRQLYVGIVFGVVESEPLSPEEWAFWGTWMQAQQVLARALDRALQRDFGISKAEFSILVTLHDAPSGCVRVTDLADSLDWDKSRVSHQLTRMERRGLLERSEAGAVGRRTGITLTDDGREAVERAVLGHGTTIRRLALDRLTPEQAAAISAWSRVLLDHVER